MFNLEQPNANLPKTVNISNEVLELWPYMVSLRRHFHRNPEISLKEFATQKYIIEELHKMGIHSKSCGTTGVVALIEGKAPGKCVLLRGDIDALPMQEDNSHSYASTISGVMHACGHDFHAASLLAAAKLLKANPPEKGSVKLCFQPAEEVGNGAKLMIKDGILNDPRPDYAVSLHVWSNDPTGIISVDPGPRWASVAEWHLTIEGKGCHAAMPHQGNDVILCGSHIVTAWQSIVSRRTDPTEPAVLSVTMFHAGTAFNILAPTAKLTGTVRLYDRELEKAVPIMMEEIAQGIAKGLDCVVNLEYVIKNTPTINDPFLASELQPIAHSIVGREKTIRITPSMGGEDFGAFHDEGVPCIYAFIGGRNESIGASWPHHHPKFDIDEASLPVCAEFFVKSTHHLLGL